MDDVGLEYSTWTWLSPAGQGTYGPLRRYRQDLGRRHGMWVKGAFSHAVAVRACRAGMLYEEVGMLSRGRLRGGRPHARWQRRARGMGSEPTKISCTSCHPSYDGHR